MTGEEVSYAHTDRRTGISSAIQIASTEFPALGITTTLLPSSLFIIKKGENKVQLARSAQDALKEVNCSIRFNSCWYWNISHIYI